jgi:hypothetical protein
MGEFPAPLRQLGARENLSEAIKTSNESGVLS